MDDSDTAKVDANRLAAWWATLSNSHRREAYGLGRSSPMPKWMVTSLVHAGIPGLIETPNEPADMLPPWFAMPGAVAELVARRRRVDADA